MEISLDSPALNVINDDAITVSTPQLDIEEIETVYLFFPEEQFVTLPKTPTSVPGEALEVLSVGVTTAAQAVEPPPVFPPPPPPGLPFCAKSGGIDTRIMHVLHRTVLIRRFLIDSLLQVAGTASLLNVHVRRCGRCGR